QAVQGVLSSKFKSTGQTCISTNRVYVQEGIAEEFSKRLAEKVAQLTIGNGLDEGTDVGTLIDKNSMEKVAAQVEEARQHNGEIICGGKIHTADNVNGYFTSQPSSVVRQMRWTSQQKKLLDQLLLYLSSKQKKKLWSEQTTKNTAWPRIASLPI